MTNEELSKTLLTIERNILAASNTSDVPRRVRGMLDHARGQLREAAEKVIEVPSIKAGAPSVDKASVNVNTLRATISDTETEERLLRKEPVLRKELGNAGFDAEIEKAKVEPPIKTTRIPHVAKKKIDV
jgi:hypothetical protein